MLATEETFDVAMIGLGVMGRNLIHPPVGAGGGGIERYGLENGLDQLQPFLAPYIRPALSMPGLRFGHGAEHVTQRRARGIGSFGAF